LEFDKNPKSKLKDKIQFVFELIRQVDRVPDKFLSPMAGSEGLLMPIQLEVCIFAMYL